MNAFVRDICSPASKTLFNCDYKHNDALCINYFPKMIIILSEEDSFDLCKSVHKN